uniref:EF-hand domain-containing protein n=1 Tax=Chromera velia CCMP2878 TaxID=1169474 RepID=A0A0G4G8P1_9ALVE|eukprot:Cvel_4337.t1-p1 / transcript=Cvel_4337.t1 / gene=Cvel_4337 / organism=Chromera_velia_CCMP2878 / gene_product=hypothetical protein / transcript_product=hypothetical protein / location=Cvel_scaffold188:29856-30956(+) / protein_length=174 / sequence_SO=supercontig / SO=protein_coding / is_pseudo=false
MKSAAKVALAVCIGVAAAQQRGATYGSGSNTYGSNSYGTGSNSYGTYGSGAKTQRAATQTGSSSYGSYNSGSKTQRASQQQGGYAAQQQQQQQAAAGGKKTYADLTEKELEEYRKDFVDFDVNTDGHVDAQEIRAALAPNLSPKDLYQFFFDVDKDESGTVTMEEYVNYAVTLS